MHILCFTSFMPGRLVFTAISILSSNVTKDCFFLLIIFVSTSGNNAIFASFQFGVIHCDSIINTAPIGMYVHLRIRWR